MYGEEIPAQIKKIRQDLLLRMHTWFLIDSIMWHIGARYHPAGISSGRSIMSCVLDTWSQVTPTVETSIGPGMIIAQYWWSPQILITELERREIYIGKQLIFKELGLQALTFEELTILSLEVMRRATINMINYHGWNGLADTLSWIRSILNHLDKKSFPDKLKFLPRRMFGKELPTLNSHIRALIEELKNRLDRAVLCPYKGIVHATPEEANMLFE